MVQRANGLARAKRTRKFIGEREMECPDLLPLGSVVRIRGNDKTLMVISRAVVVKDDERQFYYDYGCCLWPEGLMSDAVVYCNDNAVEEVLFRGLENDDERKLKKEIVQAVASLDIPKGAPGPLGVEGVIGK